MEMLLVKFNDLDLLVEDLEALALVEKHKKEIIELQQLTLEAMKNFMDTSYSPILKDKSKKLKGKFSHKFVFGFPFDSRSGQLYALDKRISYIEMILDNE